MDGWIADASALEQMASRDCGDAGFTPHHTMVVPPSSNPMAVVRSLVKDSSRSGIRRVAASGSGAAAAAAAATVAAILPSSTQPSFSTLRFNFQYPVTTDFQYDWLLRATRPTLALAVCGETRITCQLSQSQSLSLEQPLTLDFDTIFQYYFHHFSNHFHSDFRLFFSVGYLLMSEGSPSQQGSRPTRRYAVGTGWSPGSTRVYEKRAHERRINSAKSFYCHEEEEHRFN